MLLAYTGVPALVDLGLRNALKDNTNSSNLRSSQTTLIHYVIAYRYHHIKLI